MNPEEVLIPIVFFVSIAGVLGAYIFTRHRERMSMIERGLKAEDIKSLYERQAWQVNPLGSLKWGMVLICVGIAVLIGIYLNDVLMYSDGIFPGLIALFGGLGLVVFYFIANKRQAP